jgi:hypothetical protein
VWLDHVEASFEYEPLPHLYSCCVARTVVVSKALRKVDQETRKEIRDKRLLSLEADNYAIELSVEAEEDYSEEVMIMLS